MKHAIAQSVPLISCQLSHATSMPQISKIILIYFLKNVRFLLTTITNYVIV